MRPFSDLPRVLSAAQMREADRITMEEIGIPGCTLMESAGREISNVAQEMIEVSLDVGASEPAQAQVVCMCGKGNNGGDGFVVARYLSGYGHHVRVILLADREDYTGDAKQHLDILERIASSQGVKIDRFAQPFEMQAFPKPDLIVDALLGTGLASAPRGEYADAIAWMNAIGAPILSVDVPSGLSSDSGLAYDPTVRAHVTVSLAALKTGLLLQDGPEHVGALQVVDIGIPQIAYQRAAANNSSFLSTDTAVALRLPSEPGRSAHKFTTGPTLVVGGSAEYTGAPVLASLGAARSGSTYVVCNAPSSIHSS